MLMLPTFVLLFSVHPRRAGVLVYRASARADRMPLALASAVPSLSISVVITEIGLKTKAIDHDMAAAMVGAALLSVLLFPTIAGVLLPLREGRSPVASD